MTRTTTANWWKFLVIGASVLGAVIITTSVVGEVTDSWWLPMFITLIGSVMVIAAGLILGIAHLASRRPPNAPG